MEKQCDKCGSYISDLDYANGGGLCDSCRQTQELCKNCGNPQKMYWCEGCGTSGEDDFCDMCKLPTEEDKDYHLDCNKIKDDTCTNNPNNDESHICIKCANIPLQ